MAPTKLPPGIPDPWVIEEENERERKRKEEERKRDEDRPRIPIPERDPEEPEKKPDGGSQGDVIIRL